jgi:hypothetical protein
MKSPQIDVPGASGFNKTALQRGDAPHPMYYALPVAAIVSEFRLLAKAAGIQAFQARVLV